jgi:hypothetical protein
MRTWGLTEGLAAKSRFDMLTAGRAGNISPYSGKARRFPHGRAGPFSFLLLSIRHTFRMTAFGAKQTLD